MTVASALEALNDVLARYSHLPAPITDAVQKLYLAKSTKKKKKKKYVTDLGTIGQRVEGGQSETSKGSGLPEYDIIIVGGGTSGCVLAARLTENPNIRVLLLEAGGSGRAIPESRIPAAYSQLFYVKKHVHAFWTEAQSFANGAKKFWPRAKMLGGCSSINAQMAQYGAPGDFDEWASIIKDESFAWKNFSRSFRKFESYQPHRDFPNVDVSARGTTGPVQVGFNNSVSIWCNKFVQACLNVGIPSTNDFNGPNGTIGAARVMTYVDNKRERSSAEGAYLTPEVLARPNLVVAINATVTRVLFERDVESTVASGVEFANSEDGPRFQARAKKQVIISAGAVQSPHLLLLSGIGPTEHLQEHSIPVVHHLPGVGKNLVDHPIFDMNFLQKGCVQSFAYLKPKNLIETFWALSAVARYSLGAGGPLAMNYGEAAAFVRTDDPVLFPASEYPEKLIDSTSAKDSPDLEYFSTPSAYKQHTAVILEGHTYAIHVYLVRPTSHGTIRLLSSDPFAYPRVDPNYLATREDLVKLVRGVRLGLKISRQDPLKSILDHDSLDPQFDHQLYLKTDAELEDIVRERVETVYHPTSTCRMAPLEEDGVVDSKLNVYGIKGLKVCDASVFPSIISGHTAGACFAIAEKLADQIKAEL
ncbi:Dehydrogenase str4 [Psilocybe cubensis]|uniref:Dehydrogenase str4 n=2 Tax=Psilocybe cubensis TaxID=181762 RepID=A0ACB8H1N0_PSICU|nr:Dehydrogenase str4 [Psilocybe cubensis]KAH9481749.1 Dehydrogenase str4 [Psilocybe cubensis]